MVTATTVNKALVKAVGFQSNIFMRLMISQIDDEKVCRTILNYKKPYLSQYTLKIISRHLVTPSEYS
jgi:hypothetical protein